MPSTNRRQEQQQHQQQQRQHHQRHNVDICVTCVSDKPPRLPLREELPSLGIEVVYNGRGVGERAVQDEAEAAAAAEKNYRKDVARKLLLKNDSDTSHSRRRKMDPPSRDDIPLDEHDDMDFIPKALSYGSYQHALEQAQSREGGNNNDNDDDEEHYDENHQPLTEFNDRIVPTDDVLTKIDEPTRHGKTKHSTNFAKDNNSNSGLPPRNIQFPTSPQDGDDVEQQAINDAFRAFAEPNDNKTDTSTLASSWHENQGQHQMVHTIKISTTRDTRDEFPDLLSSSDDTSEEESDDIDTDSERSNGNGNSNSNSTTEDHGGGNGNIRVKLFSHGSNITEMYDLTELSDAGNTSKHDNRSSNKDLLTFSTKRGFASAHTITTLGANPHGNFIVNLGQRLHDTEMNGGDNSNLVDLPIPQVDDGYGNLVLDLSYVEEEDGPGSPLVFSPRHEQVEDDVIYSPLDSPAMQRVQGYDDKKKKTFDHSMALHHEWHDMSNIHAFNAEEDRQDDEILESPTTLMGNHRRDAYFSPCGNSNIVNKGSFSHESSFQAHAVQPHISPSEPTSSMLRLADAYHFQRPSQGSTNAGSQLSRSYDKYDRADLSLPTMNFSKTPQIFTNNASPTPGRTSAPDFSRSSSPPISPVTRKDASNDLTSEHKTLRVSFSRDVEERFYDSNDDVDFKTSDPSHKKPLESDLTYSHRSAVSREADSALQTLADKLGMEDHGRSPEVMFIEALAYGEPIPFDFEDTIKRNPDLASACLPDINTYALHAACKRTFPDRFKIDKLCSVQDLVDDIMLEQKLIHTLAVACPHACTQVDSKGDLPVHIMARQLMEWEARWYQKVYEKAKTEDNEEENGRGITKLYQTMSECINTLLRPVSSRPELCQHGGSVGRLLPLHIAAIFTVSYATLKSLLDVGSEAASIKCDLGTVRTFIPDHCTALELHDRLSTDFPKWEIRRADYDPSKEITQEILDRIYGTKNAMRRSDLLFASYPGIMPYRAEEDRIRRLETLVRSEMLSQEATCDFHVDEWIRIFWLFICQFEDESAKHDGESVNFAGSVERITKSLSVASISFLSQMESSESKFLIDQSTSQCRNVLLDRLRQAAEREIPIPICSLRDMPSTGSSIFLRQYEEEMAHRYCLRGRGFLGPLCRSLFNVTDGSFPSSFVILPYKLVQDSQGRLGLDSGKAAAVAMKFADSLLQLTSPQSIIQALDRKSSRFIGRGLVADENDEWWHAQHRLKSEIREFLRLYENGPGYFYFLDEYTGTPIVNDSSFYPLVVREAADVVRKVLPLMLSGMILMRGDKAVNIVAAALLDENVIVLHPHWIETAKDLVGFLFSPRTELTSSYVGELLPLRSRLLAMIENGSTTPAEIEKDGKLAQKTGLTSEWVVETSLVKMLVEMHDPRHTLGGLRPRRSGGHVVWTRERAFLHPDAPEYMMRIDFKSVEQLKRMNENQFNHTGYEKDQARPAKEESTNHEDHSKYADLFEDLAIPIPDEEKGESESDTSGESSDDDDSSRDEDLPKVITTPTAVQQKRDTLSSSFLQSQSILDFDDDLDLDEVLKIRIQLDEQETKMEYLREKIQDLADAEDRLFRQEEKMQQMLDEMFMTQKNLADTHLNSKPGLSKARRLLLRICDLEERVLCREVEIGQLSNSISLFEIEASTHMEQEDIWEKEQNRIVMRSSSDSSEPQKTKRHRQLHLGYTESDHEEDKEAEIVMSDSELDAEDLTIDSSSDSDSGILSSL